VTLGPRIPSPGALQGERLRLRHGKVSAAPVDASRVLASTITTRVALPGHPYPWSSSRRLGPAEARREVDFGRKGRGNLVASRTSAAQTLRTPQARSITNRPLRWPSYRLGGPFVYFRCQGRLVAKLAGQGDPRKPRLTGEGDFVSIHNPSKPSEQRKRRKSAFAEISSATAALPRCVDTPTPDEKASRLADLRAVLANSAPQFLARARRTGEGQP
jgi:hypothetical protein